MTGPTRRSLLAALCSAATAGCLSEFDRTVPDESEGTATGMAPSPSTGTTVSPTATGTTADAETTPADAGSTTGDWVERASNSPDPDHSILLRNETADAATVGVRVVRDATGVTVFEATEEVPPGGERSLYNLRRADPEGVESFTVCARLVAGARGTNTGPTTSPEPTTGATGESRSRDCAMLRTNRCYGDAYVTVREESVRIVYAVC